MSSAVIHRETVSSLDPRIADRSWLTLPDLLEEVSAPALVYACLITRGGCGRAWLVQRKRCNFCGAPVRQIMGFVPTKP